MSKWSNQTFFFLFEGLHEWTDDFSAPLYINNKWEFTYIKLYRHVYVNIPDNFKT